MKTLKIITVMIMMMVVVVLKYKCVAINIFNNTRKKDSEYPYRATNAYDDDDDDDMLMMVKNEYLSMK